MPVVLNRGRHPRGRQEISRGRKPLQALQNGKFLNGNVSLPNVTPVLLLCRCMLFGLVPVEVEVGVKFLAVLQAELEPACKHSEAQLG